MTGISLLHSTNHQKVDQILQGIISLYEMVFPGRIRGYYLVGSYADGSATPTSDIDLQIWFKEGFIDQEEKDKARLTSQRISCDSGPYNKAAARPARRGGRAQ